MGFGVLWFWVLGFVGSGLRGFVYLGFGLGVCEFWGLWVLGSCFRVFCESVFLRFVGFGVLVFVFRSNGVSRGVAPLTGP